MQLWMSMNKLWISIIALWVKISWSAERKYYSQLVEHKSNSTFSLRILKMISNRNKVKKNVTSFKDTNSAIDDSTAVATGFNHFFYKHMTHIGYGYSWTLHWRHNDHHDGVSNHQPRHCLLNGLFRRRSKKTLKLRVTDLCTVNSPGTGASNAENVSIWWRLHEVITPHAVECLNDKVKESIHIYSYIYIYMY